VAARREAERALDLDPDSTRVQQFLKQLPARKNALARGVTVA
jgi:hypothetical protein